MADDLNKTREEGELSDDGQDVNDTATCSETNDNIDIISDISKLKLKLHTKLDVVLDVDKENQCTNGKVVPPRKNNHDKANKFNIAKKSDKNQKGPSNNRGRTRLGGSDRMSTVDRKGMVEYSVNRRRQSSGYSRNARSNVRSRGARMSNDGQREKARSTHHQSPTESETVSDNDDNTDYNELLMKYRLVRKQLGLLDKREEEAKLVENSLLDTDVLEHVKETDIAEKDNCIVESSNLVNVAEDKTDLNQENIKCEKEVKIENLEEGELLVEETVKVDEVKKDKKCDGADEIDLELMDLRIAALETTKNAKSQPKNETKSVSKSTRRKSASKSYYKRARDNQHNSRYGRSTTREKETTRDKNWVRPRRRSSEERRRNEQQKILALDEREEKRFMHMMRRNPERNQFPQNTQYDPTPLGILAQGIDNWITNKPVSMDNVKPSFARVDITQPNKDPIVTSSKSSIPTTLTDSKPSSPFSYSPTPIKAVDKISPPVSEAFYQQSQAVRMEAEAVPSPGSLSMSSEMTASQSSTVQSDILVVHPNKPSQHEPNKLDIPTDQGDKEDEEEDEALLRKQVLLTLVANRRDKKQEKKANQDKPVEQQKKRHMCSPVVINLGEDSSDEEAVLPSDSADVQESSVVSSFLGGLDSFLKNARQSVEKIPTVFNSIPKTPDAVINMSQDKVAEYRKLRDEIAKREAKNKQKKDDIEGTIKKDKGLIKSVSETNLTAVSEQLEIKAKEKKMVELQKQLKRDETEWHKQEEQLLSNKREIMKVRKNLIKKRQFLRVSEDKVKKLKEQLAAAVKIVNVNKMQVGSLENVLKDKEIVMHHQTKLLQEKSKILKWSGHALAGDKYKLPSYSNSPTIIVGKRKSIENGSNTPKKMKQSTSSPLVVPILSPSKKGKARKPNTTDSVSIEEEKIRLKALELQLKEKLMILKKDSKIPLRVIKKSYEKVKDDQMKGKGKGVCVLRNDTKSTFKNAHITKAPTKVLIESDSKTNPQGLAQSQEMWYIDKVPDKTNIEIESITAD